VEEKLKWRILDGVRMDKRLDLGMERRLDTVCCNNAQNLWGDLRSATSALLPPLPYI